MDDEATPGPAGRLHRLLVQAAGGLAAAAILAMTLLITLDVTGRYLFGRPTLIAVEMSGYLLVAMVFLGLAYTDHRGRHIQIAILTSRLPPRGQAVLGMVNTAIASAFCLWLAWLTLQPVLLDRAFGTVSLTGTRTPIWIPSAAIPLGLALVGLHLLARLAWRVTARR